MRYTRRPQYPRSRIAAPATTVLEGGWIMQRVTQISGERSRLERELDRLEPGGLAIIAGSAGYGKSSSVSSWASRADAPVRWIRAAGNITDALLLAADQDGGVWLPRLGRAARKGGSLAASGAALCADLAAPHASITLVIDNADALTTDVDGLALLRTIAERDPDGARVIFIGRRSTALRLATARSKRGVLEIGAQALRISPQQTRQIAEARGWTGSPSMLEEARRAAAGNGGILAAWLCREADHSLQGDLDDFIRRDVVGASEPLLRRLTEDRESTPNLEILQTLWGEGLLLAPAAHDELGGDGWAIPVMIAEVLRLPGEVAAVALPAAEHAPPLPSLGRAADRRVIIHDLGPLMLEIDDRIVDSAAIRPRSLALLTYLATRPRHAATREEVIDALWPDAEPQAGLNSLNQMRL